MPRRAGRYTLEIIVYTSLFANTFAIAMPIYAHRLQQFAKLGIRPSFIDRTVSLGIALGFGFVGSVVILAFLFAIGAGIVRLDNLIKKSRTDHK